MAYVELLSSKLTVNWFSITSVNTDVLIGIFVLMSLGIFVFKGFYVIPC